MSVLHMLLVCDMKQTATCASGCSVHDRNLGSQKDREGRGRAGVRGGRSVTWVRKGEQVLRAELIIHHHSMSP